MIYSFLYVIIYSCASVFIEKLYFSIPPLFSLMITATVATLYFNIVNIGKLKTVYVACWRERKLWFSIMISILIIWSCTMVAPGMIGASFFNFLCFSWLGMVGFLSSGIIDWKKNRAHFVFFFCILILIIVSIFDYLIHSFTRPHIWGILMGIVAGNISFLYFKQSQAIVKRIQLSATQILAVRFYLTIFALFIFLPKNSFSLYFSFLNIIQLFLLACASLILPLYFMQKALEKITSEQSAIIISLSPAATAFLQQIIFQNIELKFIIIYLLYSIIIAISYGYKKYTLRGIK